jgi:hypothetical protein
LPPSSLPEEDPLAFEMFMGWLYQGIIEEPVDLPGQVRSALKSLVAFAERYDMSELADTTMDSLISQYQNKIPLDSVPVVYQNTKTGSRLRRFYIKALAYASLAKRRFNGKGLCIILRAQKDILPDFLEELMMESGVKQVDPVKLPACTWHGHGKDEPCPTASKKRKRDLNDE